MKSLSGKIALFPLSAHLLPGGRLSLRIFEQRYLRMVKQSFSDNSGFVVCMLNAQGDKARNQHIYPIGTYCHIVDFEALHDGLLGITVEAQYCVTLDKVETQPDGLRVARYTPSTAWPQPELTPGYNLMRLRLQELFDKYPEIKGLYEEPKFDDALWVVYRWLELLPVNAEKKRSLLAGKGR